MQRPTAKTPHKPPSPSHQHIGSIALSCRTLKKEKWRGRGDGSDNTHGHRCRNCSMDTSSCAAFALSLVLLLRLAGCSPPHSCSLLRVAWLADPFYLDSHIDVLALSDTDPVTGFVRSTSSLSCRAPLDFDLLATSLPCLLNAWLTYLSSLQGPAPLHVCAAAYVLPRRVLHLREHAAMAVPQLTGPEEESWPWWRTVVEPYLKPPRTTPQPLQNLVEPWNQGGWNLTSNHRGPPRSPCRTWNLTSNHPGPPRSRGTLVESSWNLTSNHPGPPTALAESGGTLVEPSWNFISNHPGPPRSPRRTWWNFGEPSNLASNHPGPPRCPRGTWWKPGGTLVEPYLKPSRTSRSPCRPWWNSGGTLVEPLWNPRGTLVEPYLRAAPDHPGPYLG